MRTKKFNSRDFDFETFLDTMVSFIENNFLLESPDAADTMRYFYSFANELNKAVKDKDFDKWQMVDFKNAILEAGETIFIPFSSGPDMDGSVNLASGENIQLLDDNVSLSLTDCFGLLVSLEKGKYVFRSAVAWGDSFHSVECASHPKIDKAMSKFLKAFVKK